MSEQKIPIPARLYNAAVGGHVAGADQIVDDNENKKQSQINAEVKQNLGQGGSVDVRINQAKTDIIGGASSNGNTLKKIEDRVSPLELSVGSGGSVDSRIASAVATETARAQAAEEQLRTLYNNLQQSQPIPVTSLPATGEAGKIYRLAGTNSYADYMYAEGALTTPIKMAEYDNAIDNKPTRESENLVKSGGVFEKTKYIDGIIFEIDVTISSGTKDSGFIAIPTIVQGSILNIEAVGGTVDWLSFYNARRNKSKYLRTNSGTLNFNDDDYVYIRIETAAAVSSNTTFHVTVKLGEYLLDLFNKVNENTDGIKAITTPNWEYGNIYPDGSIVQAENRIHSKLIAIDNIEKISCASTQYIGYALYNNDKEFISGSRWWNEDVSELDLFYISNNFSNAKYIAVLMTNSDNSDFVLDSASPKLYFDIVNNNEKKPVQYTEKMAVYNKNLPVIIFNFDDCEPSSDYEVVKLFESKGVRCGFAFIATEQNITEKAKLYLDFQRRGFDILNHSSDVNSIIESNYTFEEARANIATALERLQKVGFVVNGFVAPNSELSASFLPIVKALHAYHFIGTPYGSNDKNTDVCELVRYSLESNTKATIKSYIDSCISEGKCLTFYAHTSRFGETIEGELFDIDKVAEILEYVIAKRNNLECYVGGCDDALRYYYNLQ